MDIKKGDTVVVLSGAEKGKTGRVLYMLDSLLIFNAYRFVKFTTLATLLNLLCFRIWLRFSRETDT